MKIGIDIRCLVEGKMTGVEVYTVNLLHALFKSDNRNEYALFYNSFKEVSLKMPRFDYPHVKTFSFLYPNRLLNSSFSLLKFPRVDRMLGGVDVFFSPRYLFLALSEKCKSVVTIHDLSFIHDPNYFSLKQRLWHRLVSDKNASKKATHVIAVSQSTKNDVCKIFDIPPDKVTVIYPGIDHCFFNTTPDKKRKQEIRQLYGLDRDFILYLGTIEPRKNILGIIDAYDELRVRGKKIDLVLAGGLGWLYKDVLKRIEFSPYKAGIKLLSVVDEINKPALYQMSKMLVFPSFYEGFGFPPLEAMACGVPTIAAANSSFPEVLGGSSLYVNPFNSRTITDAMEALLEDLSLRQAMISEGLKRSKMFSWENTARDTLKVFNDLEHEKI